MTAQKQLTAACRHARELAASFTEETPELVAVALDRISALEAALAGAGPEAQQAAAKALAGYTLTEWIRALTLVTRNGPVEGLVTPAPSRLQ